MKRKKVAALILAVAMVMSVLPVAGYQRKTAQAAERNVVVVLDPGHDSTHTGASSNGLKEQVVNLKIALACKTELEQYQGVTVYMTHDSLDCPYPGTSTSDDLEQRAALGGAVGADIYVSLHNNSSSRDSASGYEIYYANGNYREYCSTVGRGVAEQIASRLSGLGLSQRGIYIKDSTDGEEYPDGSLADYYSVIRNSKRNGVPGIIVEHAFLTSSSDLMYLSNDSRLIEMGQADAAGIAAYFGLSKESIIDPDMDYSPIFDADYYYSTNPDVAAALGNDATELLEHFIVYGMNEGRQGNEEFNVEYYKNRYTDLQEAFKDDLPSYYYHYVNYGKAEGRIANGEVVAGVPTLTVYDGIDYSEVYDYSYYLEKNPDVAEAFSGNDYEVLKHFVDYGMSEGREASPQFELASYKNRYVDLRNVYGFDNESYYIHFIQYGINEGRTATGDDELAGAATVLNGVNYEAVYDYDTYLADNPDVAECYGGDDLMVLKHFTDHGMWELRTANEEFDVVSYMNRYEDLQEAFKDDYPSYYMHYINYGMAEGRNAKKAD
jgi:N-acetylmuramoyl-L-alanine amidase